MGVNIAGRSFLKLLDYTTEEIEYLLELSASVPVFRINTLKARILFCYLRRLPRVLAAPSKLVHLTLVWA